LLFPGGVRDFVRGRSLEEIIATQT
jgi:hypothetical protein